MTMAPTKTKTRTVCGARRSRGGEPCQLSPEPGRTRCKFHGGRNPIGPASHHWKDGRYSKYGDVLPEHLRARYERARTDPNILSLIEEISVVESQLAQAIKDAEEGDVSALWLETRDCARALDSAMSLANADLVRKYRQELLQLVEKGANRSNGWVKVQALLEQKRKLVQSERRRLVEIRGMITAEEAMGMLTQITHIITREVEDRKVLSRLLAQFHRIANAEPVQIAEEAGDGD